MACALLVLNLAVGEFSAQYISMAGSRIGIHIALNFLQ